MTEQWIYGINPVFEALTSKQHIRTVYITKGWKRDRAALLSLTGQAKVNVEEVGKEFLINSMGIRIREYVRCLVKNRGYSQLRSYLKPLLIRCL